MKKFFNVFSIQVVFYLWLRLDNTPVIQIINEKKPKLFTLLECMVLNSSLK